MCRRLLPLILLLLIAGCGQRVTTQQSATVYVHGRAPAGTLVHIYYPGGGLADATANASGYWGQTVTRQSGTFTVTAPGGCVTSGPAGATVALCKATFRLPQGDRFGDFLVETIATPEATATAQPTVTPAADGSTLIICNRVLHLEAVVVDGRLTVAMVCAEGEVQ